MAKKIHITHETIDKEMVKRNKIIEAICKECGRKVSCGAFCFNCRSEMRKTLFLKSKS